jgi:hypothetical protein
MKRCPYCNLLCVGLGGVKQHMNQSQRCNDLRFGVARQHPSSNANAFAEEADSSIVPGEDDNSYGSVEGPDEQECSYRLADDFGSGSYDNDYSDDGSYAPPPPAPNEDSDDDFFYDASEESSCDDSDDDDDATNPRPDESIVKERRLILR